LVLLLVLGSWLVTRVEAAGGRTAAFVTGVSRGPCPECQGYSDVECVKRISFDAGRIESCWGSGQTKLAGIALSLAYLMATSSFGALIGMLVVTSRR